MSFDLSGKKSTHSLIGQINSPSPKGKEIFEVLWKNDKVADVSVDFASKEVVVTQYTDDLIIRPFSKRDEEVNIGDVLSFFEERVFPESRHNKEKILESLGLTYYRPLNIVKKTHGLLFDDYMWIRFSQEEALTYEDIKIRD